MAQLKAWQIVVIVMLVAIWLAGMSKRNFVIAMIIPASLILFVILGYWIVFAIELVILILVFAFVCFRCNRSMKQCMRQS